MACARVARFDGLDPSEVERLIREADAIIRPILETVPGYHGHLELASGSGSVLSITLFSSEGEARGAEQTFDERLPVELGDLFDDWRGRRVSVELYSVPAYPAPP